MLLVIKEGQTLSISGSNLTRKQFYSKLHALIVCNLVSKANGKYRLTSFGKVVFDWHIVLIQAISKEYWKLKALDILASSGIPDSERNRIMDSLVENEKLKQFIKR
jgi:predicted transcriptional regulator